MEALLDFLSNEVIWVPIVAWMAAQLSKMIINIIVERKFVFERLFGDGGMPSGHSATVSALMAIVGWGYGFSTPLFAISLILAVIVVHDATGVRREAGKHATSIKMIVDSLNGLILEKDERIRTEKLKELVGHTPLQAFFGVLLGIAVVIIYALIFKVGYLGLIK